MDWHAAPGLPCWYNPDSVARSLRELATATMVNEASAPSSELFNEDVIHEHSGAVYPAAAPILLDIVERGHPIVRDIAADLLTVPCSSLRTTGDIAIGVPRCGTSWMAASGNGC